MRNLAFQDPDKQCQMWLCSVMINKVARKVRTSHTIPVISNIDLLRCTSMIKKLYFHDTNPLHWLARIHLHAPKLLVTDEFGQQFCSLPRERSSLLSLVRNDVFWRPNEHQRTSQTKRPFLRYMQNSPSETSATCTAPTSIILFKKQ